MAAEAGQGARQLADRGAGPCDDDGSGHGDPPDATVSQLDHRARAWYDVRPTDSAAGGHIIRAAAGSSARVHIRVRLLGLGSWLGDSPGTRCVRPMQAFRRRPSWPGCDRRRARPPAAARVLPGRPGPADEVDMFDGLDSADKDPRKSPPRRGRRRARAGPRRGLRGRHGVAPSTSTPSGRRSSSRCPPSGSWTGWARRALWGSATPCDYHVVGSDASGVVLRVGLGGAQLEAGRQGRRPLQLRRRPGPLGPRRLHAGGQPAHLGLRVQLRRASPTWPWSRPTSSCPSRPT